MSELTLNILTLVLLYGAMFGWFYLVIKFAQWMANRKDEKNESNKK